MKKQKEVSDGFSGRLPYGNGGCIMLYEMPMSIDSHENKAITIEWIQHVGLKEYKGNRIIFGMEAFNKLCILIDDFKGEKK